VGSHGHCRPGALETIAISHAEHRQSRAASHRSRTTLYRMATPRKHLIHPDVPLFYHLVSRCVQRAFLCGFDGVAGKDYSYRKAWLVDRLHFLAKHFAVEMHGYSIMSNHFHLCVFHDPKAHLRWTDDEVADRWLAVSPPRTYDGQPVKPEILLEHKAELLVDSKRLAHVRKELGSVSTFMKFLKQPIARMANVEAGVTGHFFEQRFWSAALLSERAVLTAMLYVDLNPARARIAKCIEEIQHAGISERLAEFDGGESSLEAYLKPLVSGLGQSAQKLPITLHTYLQLLRLVIDTETRHPDDSPEARWQKDVASLHRRQRAYGTEQELRDWGMTRNWKRFGVALTG
jgi:putative transposase